MVTIVVQRRFNFGNESINKNAALCVNAIESDLKTLFDSETRHASQLDALQFGHGFITSGPAGRLLLDTCYVFSSCLESIDGVAYFAHPRLMYRARATAGKLEGDKLLH